MLKRLSILGTFLMGAVCSVAYGLQPSVRAGSLSLNSAARPVTNTITPTSSQQSGISTNPARGSTISKFSSSVVPVSGKTKENYNYDSSVLDEIRQQIRDLQDAQLALENNQLGQSDIEDTIINQFQTVNLTTTNRDLKNALTEIRSTNQDLQSSLDSIQQQAELLTESLNTDIDNRLKVRGLIDSNNNVSFANKSDLEPAALAQSLTSNTHAKTILTNELQPSTNSIKEIIADDLKDREILATDGTLNVEKKGSVQINESTVTNALRNSTAFKNMISDEVATKGYVTENALADKDYVTTSALNTRNYLTSDSAAIRDLATKSDIAPDTLANKLVGNTTAKTTLENAIGGTDTTTVNNLINTKLTQTGITDAQGNRQFATLNDLPVINEQTVAEALGNSDVISDAVDTALSNKNYLTSNSSTIQNLGNQISNLNTQIAQKANASDITPTNIANNLVGDSTARATLAAQIGTNETRVNELIDNQLKDSNGQIKYALKTDLPVINEETVSAALGNSNVISDAIDTALSNNTTFALKSEIAPETLGNALKDTSALNDKFALKSEVGTNETRVNELIDNRDFATKTALTNAVGTVTTSLNTLNSYVNGNVDTDGSLLHKIKNDEDIRAALTGPQGPQGPAGQDADAVQVASILNADPIFKESVKGEPGSGFNYRGEVNQYSELPSGAQVAQGDAYYNYNDTLLYIYSCDTNNVCKFPADGNGVPFKGQPGETGQSAWYAYCISDNNLTNIIKPLYGNDVDCNTFTAAQYNAIMGGPRAYCLSLVEKRSDLVTTTGIGAKLNTIFAEDIVTRLKNASNPFATTVTLNGGQIRFLDACEQKYLEIMAGANGTNGEPGTNGKSAAEIWCEADAENYSGQTNLYVIQKLFPNDNVNSCADFTDAQYAKIMGGAIAYCTSLSATFDRVDLNNGIGLNLARVLVNTNRAANLQEAKTKLQTLQGLSASGRLENTGARIFVDTNNNPITLLQSCINNFNNIMSGNDGANGQSAKDIYCNAQAENYPSGTKNLDAIIKPLYGNNITCETFTDAQYNAIMGGARAYCLSLATRISNNTIETETISRLQDSLVADSTSNSIQSLVNSNDLPRVMNATFNNGQKFVPACEAKYNEIMAGTNGKSAAEIWCEADAENYSGQTNLYVIQKLFPNDNVNSCADFTDAQYAKIMGGAIAYCTSLSATFDRVDLNNGIGLNLARVLVNTNRAANLQEAKTKLQTLQGLSASGRLENTGARIFVDTNNNPITLLQSCINNFNNIMSGNDGANGQSAKDIYCNAQAENYPSGTKNLDAIIKPLYGNNITCETFTDAQYNAIMGGARAYCLSLATSLSQNTLDLTTGVGARLSANLGASAVAAAQSKPLDVILNDNSVAYNGQAFIPACESKYNEIMAGEDGQNGAPGANGETAWHAYCNDNNQANLTNIIQPLYGDNVDCDTFTATQYNAIMGGPRAYCLSLATNLAAGTMNLDTGIGARLVENLQPDSGQPTFAALNNPGTQMQTVLNATFNGGIRFVSACEQKYLDIMSGRDGADGSTTINIHEIGTDLLADTDFVDGIGDVVPAGPQGPQGPQGNNGKSAAEIWCEAHTLSATENIQPIALSPSQIMKSIISQGDDIINKDTKLFASMAVCLDAVAANPDLMSGESVADQEFNAKVEREGKSISEIDPSEFTSHQAGFIDSMKAELKGADGKTFVPSINAANGTLSWSAVTGNPTNPASFNLNENAVNAVKADLNVASDTSLSDALNNKAVDAIKTDLGVTSGTLSNALNTNAIAAVKDSIDASASNLQAAIDARATAKATTQVNTIKNNVLTVNDLLNLINTGALTIGTDNKVTFGNVSLDANNQNYNSQAGTLHKLQVTYSCTNTQHCSMGTVPDLISTNP